MGLRDIDREDISDWAWKWRCKVLPQKEKLNSRDIDDIADSFSDDDPKKELKAGAAAAVSNKDPTFGADAIVKTFYEGKNSDASYYDWVDFPPKQLSKSQAKAQDRVAIKVYKVKDRDKPCMSGRYPLKYHMIEIQNPTLVAALDPIVRKENVYLDVNETATFHQPFRALYFCHEEIVALYKSTAAAGDNPALRGYLQLLLRLMDDMFGELRSRKKHLQASGLVNFRLAWTYFPRGTIVYSFGRNSELLCRVETTEYKKRTHGTVLSITGKVLTFNGESFVWQESELDMPAFEGNRPVCDLLHYPLDFHPEAEAVKKRMLERGRKVLDLQGLSYRRYNGIALYQECKDKLEKHNVEGRILIDVVGYNKWHLTQGKRENKDAETQKNTVARRGRPNQGGIDGQGPGEGEGVKEKDNNKRLSEDDQKKNKELMLKKEEDLIFMSPLLEGYALKNKLWVSFYVEDIEPMSWNDDAYEHLVYDEQQKDLVLSFVENHGKSAAVMEDVIVGKGQGLIILLSGPPGTGKTLMAEATADYTRRPLFYLQAEDLGINAATLGANIKRVFEMATEWSAVILLDEADVFMAERNPNDIHRNELVSIFLRELEYFRGIIFLTTNLYHTIDSAFRSRVSLHLLFKPLTADAREMVWRKFLNRLPEAKGSPAKAITHGVVNGESSTDGAVSGKGKDRADEAEDEEVEEVERNLAGELTDEELKELGLWSLNGREIKNAVKMVRSWCDHKGYDMSLSRLESGIKVTSPHASKEGKTDDSLYD